MTDAAAAPAPRRSIGHRALRIAAWTLAADRADADYGLRLPGVDIAPAEGAAQRARCLEALALWH